jgi:hypothetical protein
LLSIASTCTVWLDVFISTKESSSILKALIAQNVAARNENLMCIYSLEENGRKISEIRRKDGHTVSGECHCG